MSLVWFKDVQNGNSVAVNPSHVVAVFTASEGDFEGKTVVGLVNGTIIVEGETLEVVTSLNV